jgi:quercetin dioxygenase-like cupin family protein
MAIEHAQPGQAIDVRPLGSKLAAQQTIALFKCHDLEVIRLVLVAGKSLPPHRVPGEIIVQCIEGSIEVTAEGKAMCFMPGNCCI